MGRFDVSLDELLDLSPLAARAVAYMFTWGTLANYGSIIQGADAALGGRGRY